MNPRAANVPILPTMIPPTKYRSFSIGTPFGQGRRNTRLVSLFSLRYDNFLTTRTSAQINQVCIKDTAYLVSRRSSEQKAGDKPSIIFCSGNRKWGKRAKGAVPDKASDDSTYGCSKPLSQPYGIGHAYIAASRTLPCTFSYKHGPFFLVRTSCNNSNNMAGSSSSR